MTKTNHQHGIALVTVLILLAIVSLWGLTILETSSTEIAMSGHHYRDVAAFYVAEAGLEEARARLRGPQNGNAFFLGDRKSSPSAHWSAYLVAVPEWTPSQDPEYWPTATNYFPTVANPENRQVVLNSVQNDLRYWVKLQHKTEYDAERAGHRLAAPHYVDHDGNRRRHRRRGTSGIIYYGFPPGQVKGPVPFTTSEPTPFAPVERLTAYGVVGNARAAVEMEVVHPAPLPHLGTIYARQGITFSGSSNEAARVSGLDRCGRVAAISAAYTATPFRTSGVARFSGASSMPQMGSAALDVSGAVSELREASSLPSNGTRGRWGESAYPVVVYESAPRRIENVSGYGLLIAQVALDLVGPLVWRGPILSGGQIRIDARNGPVTIEGIIWANSVEVVGPATISYHSCHVQSTFGSLPLRVIVWRERM
ncbi:MAG: hypothetical protein D6690_08295 [Nitrospirae bacterium]|nr:MAG: hypothetical protein D6690_08295 [Nitrospirota bacterium]